MIRATMAGKYYGPREMLRENVAGKSPAEKETQARTQRINTQINNTHICPAETRTGKHGETRGNSFLFAGLFLLSFFLSFFLFPDCIVVPLYYCIIANISTVLVEYYWQYWQYWQ